MVLALIRVSGHGHILCRHDQGLSEGNCLSEAGYYVPGATILEVVMVLVEITSQRRDYISK